MLIRFMWALTVAVVLSACQGITTLPDGQPSAMHGISNQLRGQLSILSLEPRDAVAYIPTTDCSYREVRLPVYEAPTERRLALSMKAVGNRILVVARDGNQIVSSHLISKRGKLYDFNVIDPSTSERVTSDNYDAAVNRKLSKMRTTRDSGLAGLHIINEFSLVIPEYTTTTMHVGDTVAAVLSEDGALWGEYKFRGTTLFAGISAGLFDLIRVQITRPQYGPTVVGFSIVDLTTMLPLMVVLDSGSTYYVERISCSQ